MAELTTIARPYARAAFEVAQAAGALDRWSQTLGFLSQIAADPRVRAMLGDPRVSDQRRVEFFTSIAGERLDGEGSNFVRLLSQYDRLGLLPQIAEIFETLKNAAEGTIDVSFTSVAEVDDAYRQRLAQALKKKLGREVHLHFATDPALLGGAVIRAGDMVIDGSVRSRLDKLAGVLAG